MIKPESYDNYVKTLENNAKEFVANYPLLEDVNCFNVFCKSPKTYTILYNALIGHCDKTGRQERYDDLREYFECENLEKFIVMFSELAFFSCGFGISNFDKITKCVETSKLDPCSGCFLWYIPEDSKENGSIEFIFYIDAKIRDFYHFDCKINEGEVVPFLISAKHVKNDTFVLNKKEDNIFGIAAHFPRLFGGIISASDIGFCDFT